MTHFKGMKVTLSNPDGSLAKRSLPPPASLPFHGRQDWQLQNPRAQLTHSRCQRM
ncbi:hypothetical protein TRP66_06545 [Pseudomonas sp. JDS28PS106]|uniref:hypothetical protein n=1 Tax=Pseudomonas sp. JDS28PS106 TaxID=2497235 RepID=UPI002FD3F0A7